MRGSLAVTFLAVVTCSGAAGADCSVYVPPVPLAWGGVLYQQDTAGWSIAIDGNRIAVGDPWYAPSATSPQGWIYVWRQSATGRWVREASLWGDYLTGGVVRMKSSLIVARAVQGTALSVYEDQPTAQGVAQWVRLGSLTAPSVPGQASLYAGALDYDGATLAVLRTLLGRHTPQVDVYARDASQPLRFTLTSSIVSPVGDLAGSFGRRVAVSGDIIVIESTLTGANPGLNVYQNIGGAWTFAQRFEDAAGPRAGVTFGIDIALKGDTLAFSVGHDPGTPNVVGQPSGEVRVYRRTPAAGGPDQWAFEQTLTLPGGSTTDGFGGTLALKANTLVVGAPNQNHTGPTSGALHLFERSGSTWAYRAVLGKQDAAGARIGFSLAVSQDIIAAGAPGYLGRGAGMVFDQCSETPPGTTPPACLPGILGLYTFVDAWMNGNMFADFNLSGALEFADLFDFLNAWLAGCP